MFGRRSAYLVLVIAVAALGCANGRPKPWTCATVGALAGAGAGVGFGHEYLEHSTDEWKTGAYAVGTGVALGAAGYFLCRALQAEETPPPPPPAPPEPVVREEVPPVVVETVVAEKIVLRGVNFDFDKSEIRPDAAVILDEAVSILSGKPDTRVRVDGHTCSMGPDAYNQGLSERRAASVRRYLVDHGIDASRLTSVGYGESSPIATNDTREGRALNRRVELQVLE